MKVAVLDEDGEAVTEETGELSCLAPFPCMPVGFWNDPDGSKYRAAYFETHPNVWCHGDFARLTVPGRVVTYGRSDATLNPGGARIRTAQLTRPVEPLPQVRETLCSAQAWGGPSRGVLFIPLRVGMH